MLCGWDSASHGSWLKVPLCKLTTERTVPLDEPTLAALDEWMTRRGPQRALPHPRLNRPADFLFTERGRRLTAFRLTAFRLRRGLDDAAQRSWHTEVARHSRVIASIQAHLHDFNQPLKPDITTDIPEGRLIERWFAELTRRILPTNSRLGTLRGAVLCYAFPQYQPRHSQNAQGPCARCPVPLHRPQVSFT
jgi:hypothetical protein